MVQGGNEHSLTGINLAALVMDGLESKEFFEPLHALEEAGATVSIISAHKGKLQAYDDDRPVSQLDVQAVFDEADPREFIAVLLPGGVQSVKALCTHPGALEFLRGAIDMGKPVAAIGHGVASLAAAGRVQGKNLTGHPALKETLLKAGASWVDEPTIVNETLVTGRNKEDLPAFVEALLDTLHAYVKKHVAGTRDENADIGPGS